VKLTAHLHLGGEVKERAELYLHSPNMPSWRGAQLKHWGNFTFTSNINSISMEAVRTYEGATLNIGL
jgi:hypothetical protein